MSIPLQITFKGMDASEALEARIRDKAARLDRFEADILRCHVTVEAPHHRTHKGRVYAVQIEIAVPRGTIMVSRDHGQDHAHEDVYVALRDAFNAAARRLEDKARKIDHRVKHHEPPLMSGRIARFVADQDYGFIETAQGEVYFHRNSVAEGGFNRLRVGDEVRFAAADGEKGLQATTVHVVGKHHAVPGA
ncbi:MAG TPA: HPF/RaiA family ribosome-associated protein [Acidisphaera sp.]|nr:HPF/RaiA family ribosome-associated protein [Acidisphaera sp.]